MRSAIVLSVLLAATGAANAQFFGTTAYANGDWEAAAGPNIVTHDVIFNAGPLAPNTPFDLGNGVSLTVNGPGGSSDTLGFTFNFVPGETTQVTITFDTAITAFAWNHFNSFADGGITVSTGFNSYDVEGLSGGGVIGFVGVVEAQAFNTITFTLTNPAQPDLWFIDSPFRYAPVPAPATGAALAAAALFTTRRR